MAVYGYARVSTTDQDLDVQKTALKEAGATSIRCEKASGTTREGRTELQLLLEFVQHGDTVLVTRLDRLGRDLRDTYNIIHELKQNGVRFRTVDGQVDTGSNSITGDLVVGILAAVAEYETRLRRERQLEGIKAAKERGVYTGGKARIKPAEVRRLHDEEKLGPTEIATRLGVARSSVYRLLGGK